MTMIQKYSMAILAATAMACAIAAPVWAQGTQDKPALPPALPSKVEVVISRYQGEKKIASQPYVLTPTADPRGGYASLRIGIDVPIGTTTTTRPPEGGREGVTTTQPKYQNVGTNIDCRVANLGEGRFSVNVSVIDSSIFSPEPGSTATKLGDTSAFRTFQASNTLTMRDGQTMLLTTATDKVSGELLKIEVTFSLIK
jgi:hypothetical protein